MPKRAANFAKRPSWELQHLELFNRMMEWRNGGMAEYPKTQKDRISQNIGCLAVKNKSLKNRIADFFETLEENLEEKFPFFIQVMIKQV